MAIQLNDNIKINAGKPAESKYLNVSTPYTSAEEVISLIPSSERYIGLTVNVDKVDYYFKDGITDEDLLIKESGSITGGTNGLTTVGKSIELGGEFINANLNNLSGDAIFQINIGEQEVTNKHSLYFDTTQFYLQSIGTSGNTRNYNLSQNFTADGFEQLIFVAQDDVQISNPSGYLTVNNGVTIAGTDSVADVLTSFHLSETGFTLTDNRTVKSGVEYADDYSGEYTDRSIPDVAYVNNTAFSYGSYFANQLTGTKGIERVDNTFKLKSATDANAITDESIAWEFSNGGFQVFAHPTLYDKEAHFNLGTESIGFSTTNIASGTSTQFGATSYDDISRMNFSVNSLSGQLQLYMSLDNGFEITDTIYNRGLRYKSNYSANYSARSLVDKGYVTGLTSSLIGLTGTSATKLNPIKTIGANYTVTSNDINYVIEVTGSTNRTITVPSGLTTGFNFTINNLMASNTVTIAPGAGTTLQMKGNELMTQYDGASIYVKNNFIRGFGNLL